MEELKRQLQPKRAHTDDDVGDAHDMLAEVDNWDLRDHRQQATRVQNRRNVQVGSRMNQAKPRTGTDGFLHHTRLGLVGWISYWCLGDSALAVDILVALINTLGLTELVSDALPSRKEKEAETNAKIVDLFKDALDEIKNCRTEQQRVEFHIAWPRTRIQVLWTESHGGRLYAHQADLLDRRRIYCHSIIRDSES